MDAAARQRLLSVALVAIAFGLLAVTLAVYFTRGFIPGDALVYLGAGERLNAGHQLYALSPGDRYVGANPPYWTVPTLSPPFMGVLFRPLALLPPDLGAYVWWVGTIERHRADARPARPAGADPHERRRDPARHPADVRDRRR